MTQPVTEDERQHCLHMAEKYLSYERLPPYDEAWHLATYLMSERKAADKAGYERGYQAGREHGRAESNEAGRQEGLTEGESWIDTFNANHQALQSSYEALVQAVRRAEAWIPACTHLEQTYPELHARLHKVFALLSTDLTPDWRARYEALAEGARQVRDQLWSPRAVQTREECAMQLDQLLGA